MGTEIPGNLIEKIRNRAKRAFSGKKIHRISNVGESELCYRLPRDIFKPPIGTASPYEYAQERTIIVTKNSLGKIEVPSKSRSGFFMKMA